VLPALYCSSIDENGGLDLVCKFLDSFIDYLGQDADHQMKLAGSKGLLDNFLKLQKLESVKLDPYLFAIGVIIPGIHLNPNEDLERFRCLNEFMAQKVPLYLYFNENF
jgi:hypothetical protein